MWKVLLSALSLLQAYSAGGPSATAAALIVLAVAWLALTFVYE